MVPDKVWDVLMLSGFLHHGLKLPVLSVSAKEWPHRLMLLLDVPRALPLSLSWRVHSAISEFFALNTVGFNLPGWFCARRRAERREPQCDTAFGGR